MRYFLFVLFAAALFLFGCTSVNNFEECVSAGNPVMESYPRQCRSDGKTFTEDITDDVFCIADVKECPDGSYVQRVPPTCEFENCLILKE